MFWGGFFGGDEVGTGSVREFDSLPTLLGGEVETFFEIFSLREGSEGFVGEEKKSLSEIFFLGVIATGSGVFLGALETGSGVFFEEVKILSEIFFLGVIATGSEVFLGELETGSGRCFGEDETCSSEGVAAESVVFFSDEDDEEGLKCSNQD